MPYTLPAAVGSRAPARALSIPAQLALLLAAHVLLWTWVGVASRSNFDTPGDMVEAYVWAQGWQWGYYKHPPLSAWVAGLWFSVVPESQWGYSLLAALNGAVGLLGLALLAREFLSRRWVLLVVAMASLNPGLTTLAMRFNANAILISSWPWAMCLFVRLMRHGRARDAIGCGLACALAMLGKYYSAVLLLTLLAAALWVPQWRRRLAKREAGFALAAFALVFAPHAVWLLTQAEGPLQYAEHAARVEPVGAGTIRALNFALAQCAFPAVALVAFRFALVGRGAWRGFAHAVVAPLTPRNEVVWLLAALPIVATMAATVVTGARTAAVWGLPIASGLALLAVVRAQGAGAALDLRRLWRVLAVVWLIVALAAPLWWMTRARVAHPSVTEPREELAQALDQTWRREWGTPLPWIAGTRALAASTAFYAASHPRYWSLWNAGVETPWVEDEDIVRQGALIVCDADDVACTERAGAWSAEVRTLTVAKEHAGWLFAPRSYRVYTIAPSQVRDFGDR